MAARWNPIEVLRLQLRYWMNLPGPEVEVIIESARRNRERADRERHEQFLRDSELWLIQLRAALTEAENDVVVLKSTANQGWNDSFAGWAGAKTRREFPQNAENCPPARPRNWLDIPFDELGYGRRRREWIKPDHPAIKSDMQWTKEKIAEALTETYRPIIKISATSLMPVPTRTVVKRPSLYHARLRVARAERARHTPMDWWPI